MADAQREWADRAVEATAGLLITHFFLGTDGSRVLALRDWTTEDAHRAAPPLTGPGLTVAHFGSPLHLAAPAQSRA